MGLEAGVDTIDTAPADDELIALFKRTEPGASSLTCTVSPALPFVELDPEKTKSTEVQKVNGRIVYEGIVRAAQQALAAGIPVGLGTDSSCPYITHYDMWREVVYFERIVGASRTLALHTATLGNARILGLGDETGSIEEGKAADLIVCDQNPLDNLEALRNVRMVMARGVLDERPRVKRLAELDAELDGFLPKPVQRAAGGRGRRGGFRSLAAGR
ncbi:MAG: amidohydrolase family protein [Eggerthellaceae bacterium]